jgi:predicted glycoside hydrolase/deacetylase ChbG (UPF0249 family)
MTRLIVNADDFGLSAGVNAGIVTGHLDGIVTSTTLMVRRPAARDAARVAADLPRLGVGLHLDLGEWRFDGTDWQTTCWRVDLDDAAAVRREIDEQVELFLELVGHAPTHLDSHQHVHRAGQLVSAAVETAAARLGVPIRDSAGAPRFDGSFYGQDEAGRPYPELVSVDALVRIVAQLPADTTTEVSCHPAAALDFDAAYAGERLRELEVLCDPRVREALRAHDISLIHYGDLAS